MKIKQAALSALILFSMLLRLNASPGDEGKTIFMSRCAGCHNVNKILVGPALAGVDQRRPIDWIINFVHSSQTVVKSGDPYAVKLFEKFNKIQMPNHSDLTADNIKSVVEYIKASAVSTDAKSPFAKPSVVTTNYKPLSLREDYLLIAGYLFGVLMLIATLLIAVRVADFKKRAEEIA
jgi:hypothetical protein